MKRNMVPLLGIAFVVAIISTGVFYGLFAGKLRSSNELPGHAIVVAARDLDRGTVIQPSDLRVSEVQGVLGGAFSKPEEAAGATLLTAMKANEPLLEERVAPRVSENRGVQGPGAQRDAGGHDACIPIGKLAELAAAWIARGPAGRVGQKWSGGASHRARECSGSRGELRRMPMAIARPERP